MKKKGKRKSQRKAFARAPLHRRQDMVSAHLSKELRKVVGKRTMRVRKGYSVKVLRGENRGKEGKVTSVDLKKRKISIEGLSVKKADGKELPLFIDSSNVMITRLEAEKPAKQAQSQ
ncbi:MAG: 50S ribosomal protein L24 [Candidatus Micrarchaeia archaeon]